MAMDAIVQVRMDRETKAQVEDLYRNLGTSFSEAVRIFAQQSLQIGGMPFRPALKTWGEMTDSDIDAKLMRSMADVEQGRTVSQQELDKAMNERFANG